MTTQDSVATGAVTEDDIAPSMRRPGLIETVMRDKKAVVGVIILGLFLIAAVTAPLIAPYDPNYMEFEMIEEPSWVHPLGTDDLGRDLLSRLIYGAQVSLFVGFATVAIALVMGIALGVAAGYYGGFIDTIIMRYIDLQWAFPNFIIAVYLVAVFGTGLSNVIVAISLAYIDDFARIARGMVLTIKQEQYVDSARTVAPRTPGSCGGTCCPTRRRRSSSWPRSVSRTRSSPRPACPFLVLVLSPRPRPGG